MDKTYSIEKLKELLNSRNWNWAKTYVTIPHEYIVRGRCGLSDEDFLYIVKAQREIGIHERWGKYNFPYLYVDGYKYWTMGDTLQNTIIINRQKLFGELDSLEFDNKPYYDEDSARLCIKAMNKLKNGAVLEIGCGDGRHASKYNIIPKEYIAVEPSKKMASLFAQNNPLYAERVKIKSFEESTNLMKRCGLIVGLFGSASYIMKPYLRMIADNGNDYLLMFYKEGFYPNKFKDCHHFNYSEEEIRETLKGCHISKISDYIVGSSKLIDWEKIKYECNFRETLF